MRTRGLVLAALAMAAPVLAGCDEARRNASQEFTPITPGVLRVATALPAPGYWDTDGSGAYTGGFEYEIASALADRFDLRLEVVDVPFEQIVAGDFGGADLALAEITVTKARDEAVDFSVPYYTTGAGVVAREGEEILDLKTARDLAWGAMTGTTDAAFVADVIRPDDATLYDSHEDCVDAVQRGDIDACLLDLPTALVLEQQVDGVATVAQFTTDEQWSIAMPTGDDARHNREVVDAGMRALESDGTLSRLADELERTFATSPRDIPIIEART